MEYLISLSVVVAFLLVSPALAQTVEVTATGDNGTPIEVTVEPVNITSEATVTAVVEQPVVEENLEGIKVEEIKTAPTGFGLWWRGVKEKVKIATTFDPVKKNELRLQFAEERMKIAQKIVETSTDVKAQERAQKVIDGAQSLMTKVESAKDKWLNNPDERAQRLLKNVVTYELNKESILNKIEEKIPADKLPKWEEMRDKITTKGQGLLKAINNENMPEAVKTHLEDVKNKIEAQTQIKNQFREEKQGLLEKTKAGDETAKTELKNLQEEKKAKLEEVKANWQEKKEEFKDKVQADEVKVQPILRKIENLKENVQNRLPNSLPPKPAPVPVLNNQPVVNPPTTAVIPAENTVGQVQ